jgi:hypothetical protein
MAEQTQSPQETGQTIRAGGCAGCTLCCKVMSIPALNKAAGVWCPHCKTGVGCGIYEKRPVACIDFMCGFLTMPSLGEEWRPATSRLIIDTQKEEGTMLVYVDPARPDAWKRQPYYAGLQNWARWALAHKQRVVVRTGARTIMVMPDHAIDFGTVYRDEVLAVFPAPRAGGSGVDYNAYAAKVEMWAKLGHELQQGKQIPTLADGFRQGRRLD